VTIDLPNRFLKAGRYTLDFGAGRPNLHHFDHRPEALTFDIEENSENLSHTGYAKKRPGHVIVPLTWEERVESMTANASTS
jgi:hypothetical protein